MATVIVLLTDAPVTAAVITSVPEAQLLSVYVAVAVPETDVTGLVSVALELAAHGEVNVTEIGVVAGAPLMSTGTLTALEPYAEIDELPRAIAPRVTVAPLTAIPTGVLVSVVVVPPVVTSADAVIVVAPAEEILAASNVTEAVPSAAVKAVANVGVNTTIPVAAAKVATTLGTGTPLAFVTVTEA